MKRFTIQTPSSLRVDRDARCINGVAIASTGPANDDTFDATTLQMLAVLGNSGRVRARLNHPNRADPRSVEQDLQCLLGEYANFRVDGDVCRADVKLAGVNLDAEEMALNLAEKCPHLFGISVVFEDTPPPKGQKPKRGDPCRPTALYAGDFVDLPAANAAGLFAAKAAEGQAMDPVEMYAKDGKLFCNMEGKEVQLNHTPESLEATKGMIKEAKKKEGKETDDDDEDSEEMAKKKAKQIGQALTPADIEKARTEAVEGERTYRKMFSTIVASAKLTGAAVDEFEKNFYGRAEADLKFLAQHAIGDRAKPLGEGSGEQEKKPQPEGDKADSEVRAYCVKRFSADSSIRRRFRVNTDNPEDPAYKDGLARFFSVEKKCRADEAGPAKRDGNDEASGNDPVTRIMKNSSVLNYVR